MQGDRELQRLRRRDPSEADIFAPRGVGQFGEGATMPGLVVERTKGGVLVVRTGRFQQFNWEYHDPSETLSLQLVASDLARSTRVTTGRTLTEPLDGQREVAGTITDQWMVVPLVAKPRDPSKTLTRAELEAAMGPLSARGAPGLVLVDARRPDRALVMTQNGIGSLWDILTSSDYDTLEMHPEGQRGEIPLALKASTLFSTVSQLTDRRLSDVINDPILDASEAVALPIWFGPTSFEGQQAPMTYRGVSQANALAGVPQQLDPNQTRTRAQQSSQTGSRGPAILAYGKLVPYDAFAGRPAFPPAGIGRGARSKDTTLVWAVEVAVPLDGVVGNSTGGLPPTIVQPPGPRPPKPPFPPLVPDPPPPPKPPKRPEPDPEEEPERGEDDDVDDPNQGAAEKVADLINHGAGSGIAGGMGRVVGKGVKKSTNGKGKQGAAVSGGDANDFSGTVGDGGLGEDTGRGDDGVDPEEDDDIGGQDPAEGHTDGFGDDPQSTGPGIGIGLNTGSGIGSAVGCPNTPLRSRPRILGGDQQGREAVARAESGETEPYDDSVGEDTEDGFGGQLHNSLGRKNDEASEINGVPVFHWDGLDQGLGGKTGDGSIGGAHGDPRQAHAVYENNRYARIRVPAPGDLVTREELAELYNSLKPGALGRVALPNNYGAADDIWGYAMQLAKLLNSLQELIDAAFIGDRRKIYAGNINILHNNQNEIGVAENNIGVNHHDLTNDDPHATALNIIQGIWQEMGQTVELGKPALLVSRNLYGLVTPDVRAALIRARKVLVNGAIDESDWLRFGARDDPNARVVDDAGVYLKPDAAKPKQFDCKTPGYYAKIVGGLPVAYYWDGFTEFNLQAGTGGGTNSGMALLVKFPGVDFTTIAETAIYTVPAAEEAVFQRLVIIPTAITGAITSDPRIGAGIGAGANDVIGPPSGRRIPGLAIGQAYTIDIEGDARTGDAAEVLNLGIDSAVGGATVLDADVYLFGYFVSGGAPLVSGAGADTTAIHSTVAAEIVGIPNAAPALPDSIIFEDDNDGDNKKSATFAQIQALIDSGTIVQLQHQPAGASLSTTLTLPIDATAPQTSEMASAQSQAITPTTIGNRILVIGVGNIGAVTARQTGLAIFKDAGASALALAMGRVQDNIEVVNMVVMHEENVSSLAIQTWRMYYGGDGANAKHFNRNGNLDIMGGTFGSRIIVIEYTP